MAIDRAIGKGALIKVDHDDDDTFTTIGCIPEFTPPAKERDEVDLTSLEDEVEQMYPGITKASEFEVMRIWDPTDENHVIIDDLYDDMTVVAWQIVLPFPTPITGTFTGYVSKQKPEKVEKSQGVKDTFTVRLRDKIVWA